MCIFTDIIHIYAIIRLAPIARLVLGIIRFYVTTETGVFRDGDEITSQNVVEYYNTHASTGSW